MKNFNVANALVAFAHIILSEAGLDGRPTVTHAKVDTPATMPKGMPALRKAPGPSKVYVMVPGYDRKLFKAQTTSNRAVLDLIKESGKAGIAAGAIAAKGKINGKTVQSSVYHLRHMALIASQAPKA